MDAYQSWGGYPKTNPLHVHPVNWQHESITFESWREPILPYANGRSYGDSCLNDGGVLLDTKRLGRFMEFDDQRGILRCEGGVTLADILEIFVPRGWFLPVTPGTKYVSIGGAIANDVHGKNHHWAGTFGCHILAFELLRSTGERFICSLQHHADLFKATIGGLGLTGLILWADIQLKSIKSPFIETERIRYSSLNDFFDLATQSDQKFEYTVAWVDCLANGRKTGRGSFIRGNHQRIHHPQHSSPKARTTLTIPFHGPSFILNSWVMKTLNSLYYHSLSASKTQSLDHYDGFFYPLDSIHLWNRLYGHRGFLQYQCVIPPAHERDAIMDLLKTIQRSKQGSFLAVLKKFGSVTSPGLLSFPRVGTTLALDFPFLGEKTLAVLDSLDHIVRATGGAVYPAKDAHMAAQDFQSYFPRWQEFLRYKDPKFSSSFWRRVLSHDSPIEHDVFPSSSADTQHLKNLPVGSV